MHIFELWSCIKTSRSENQLIHCFLTNYYKDCVISYKQILIYKHKIPNKENKQTKRIMIQLHVDICFQGA